MSSRNTASQAAVLELLENADGAVSHDMLSNEVGDRMDRATIYRILNRFADRGLVHRIIADDGRQYFALCKDCEDGEHHHDHLHFRCTKCEKVECLEQPFRYQLPEGYRATGLNATVRGVCADCA